MNDDHIPLFQDQYLVYYNKNLEVTEIRSRSKGPSAPITLPEAAQLIQNLMIRHQMTFFPHESDTSLYVFPYMFIKPKKGDRIRNTVTNEIYTVDQVINNPKTKRWDGLVKLNVVNPPDFDKRHLLVYHGKDRYINFDHAFPRTIKNVRTTNNSEGEAFDSPPMVPTITWTLERSEPGSLDGKAFGARKELKPRLREVLRDKLVPGMQVQVFGQFKDNLVRFGCYADQQTTAERLINWFQTFMDKYTRILNECGLNQVFFYQRQADDLNNVWRQPFAVRTIDYYMRTEELSTSYESEIVNIDITLGVEDTITDRLFNEERYIAGQLVTGELSYSGYRDLFYDQSGNYLFGNIDILQ